MDASQSFARAPRRATLTVLVVAGLLAPGVARANEVIRWNRIATAATANADLDSLTEAHILATLHVAVREAVNAVERRGEPDATSRLDGTGASVDAAAASAAYTVLLALMPGSTRALDAELSETLRAVPDGEAEQLGVAVGRQAADLVMAARRHCLPNPPPSCEGPWSRDTATVSWNRLAREVTEGRRLDVGEAAALFAQLNTTIFDAMTAGREAPVLCLLFPGSR